MNEVGVMHIRDDFSNDTKDLLARRVGFRCSNPNCRKPTSGPQEDTNKSINVGVAAHITAASPGGKRYNLHLTPEERKSPSNGIWLCQTCAKLIDNDEIRYTVDLINKWKVLSEQAALLDIENNNQSGHYTDNSTVVSINQSGGQTAKTIINQKQIRRTFKPHKDLIKTWLKLTPPTAYAIQILMNDLEAFDLAKELKEIFDEAGWPDGNIIKGLGGYYPPGITITRDKESEQSNNILEVIYRTGLKNVTGQAAFKGDRIGIYIGPNPDNYV